MKKLAFSIILTVYCLVSQVAAEVTAADQGQPRQGVQYLGSIQIPGSSTDLSGLTDMLEDPQSTPHNQLGSHGSGIAWTGKGNRYIMLADRGPADGAASFKCRFHEVEITATKVESRWLLEAKLLATRLLQDEEGRCFVGKSDAPLRFDPEGLCILPSGNLMISDEYGPYIYEFSPEGKKVGSIPVPGEFLVQVPDGDPVAELKKNSVGRQPNRGMEGLAITPSGRYLVGIMQSPLIQDGAVDDKLKRVGLNIRLLMINLTTRKPEQFIYHLDNPKYGVNEILAIGEDDFLVIERDGKDGAQAKFKAIYRVKIIDATEVSSIKAMPVVNIPEGARPVGKKLFIDLLDKSHGLAGVSFPEKIEGLALGPELGDGGRLLLVTSDNDFQRNQPTVIYAFSVDL